MKFALVSALMGAMSANDSGSFAESIAQELVSDQSFKDAISNRIQQNLGQNGHPSFENLSIADKLKSIAKDLGTPEQLHHLWKGIKTHHNNEKNQHLTNFNINLNLELGNIDIYSSSVDISGLPLYSWHKNNKGEVKSTVRENQDDAVEESAAPVVVAAETKPAAIAEAQPAAAQEAEVQPVAAKEVEAKNDTQQASVESQPIMQTVMSTGFDAGFQLNGKTYLTPEEIEMQRDIAFKIVYFFIAFIIMTFGLLYAYYKVDQKEQEREQREKRTKGIFFEEPNQKSFFDFLAGNIDDENYLVNPNARKQLVQESSNDGVDALKTQAVFYQQ